MSLDFVKCFDKCSFSILHGSLIYFGFGKIVKEWTKLLYQDFTVKIQNNGHFSSPIDIKKGVHQGGCCSSVYFLVIAEILAICLRSNDDIEGITIRNIKHLLNQFADDMDVFSMNKEKSLQSMHEEFERFRLQSGFTVSYEKTTLYRIGSLRHSNATLYEMDQYQWSNEDINVLGITISHNDITTKNYKGIEEKSNTILNSWHNRGLSLLGKVQVVNTLIASLYVYKMMVLPQIPQSTVKKLECIIRNFLWDGKKAKIAYNILQNPKSAGGLSLVNFKNKDISLKATWPQILKKEPEYESLVYQNLKLSCIGQDIWKCRLEPKDISILKIKDDFWRDVLKSWNTFNCYYNFRIENQVIWYNSRITIEGKPFLWADLYQKGLIYLHDLFQNRRFKEFEELKQQYGITILRFNSLKAAIPKDWKTFFFSHEKSEFTPLPPSNYEMYTQVQTSGLSSKIYKFLGDDAMLLHSKYHKWNREIGESISESLYDFAREHTLIYSITNVAKYRSFQYRLMQRGLVTNVQLFKWNITESDLCFFCQEERETNIHLFWSCRVVQDLWMQFTEYYQPKYQVQIYLNPKNIIMNTVVKSKKHVVNFLVLIAKQYIYRQKCLKEALSFIGLKEIILSTENMEKYIATKNGKIGKHQKKWSSDC